MGGMERKHDLAGADHADQERAKREADAQDSILAMGADQLDARPWRPSPAPPTAADLAQYALWRSADLTAGELLDALSLKIGRASCRERAANPVRAAPCIRDKSNTHGKS